MVPEKYVTSYGGDVRSITFAPYGGDVRSITFAPYGGDVRSITFATLIFNQQTYYRKPVCEFASSYMHIHIFHTMILK
jgi:hypothetical protein